MLPHAYQGEDAKVPTKISAYYQPCGKYILYTLIMIGRHLALLSGHVGARSNISVMDSGEWASQLMIEILRPSVMSTIIIYRHVWTRLG